uniref:PAS domain-containing protein n=1 Tax=Pseudictyota dubia TaxID=2749911 RepID=A0A7R9WJG8_9STRA|mmetsp:Transcript_6213/g.10666  ORF Transcript_6213/g.10666 Transcript_6213/m.10666 type:complete len:330 (+) Transcript_6213:309-1298(+)
MIRSVTNRQIQHIVARQAPAAAASSIAVEAAAASSRAFTGAALSDCAYFSFQETSGGGVGNVNSSVPAGASASTSASADSTRGEMAYSLSFSSSSGAASDFSSFASNGFLSPIMRRQLDLVKSPEKHQVQLHQDFAEEERILIQQRTAAMHTMALADDDAAAAAEAAQEEEKKEQQHPPSASQAQECHDATMDSLPLPKTLSSALHPSETRPVVVTESRSPFKIVHVNSAWEDLCGYDRSYASGKTLGSLLGGPDTDKAAATALVTALLRGEEEAGTVLVNYRGGDKVNGTFRNRVRVGPLFGSDDDQRSDWERSQGQVKHFVGVLREI